MEINKKTSRSKYVSYSLIMGIFCPISLSILLLISIYSIPEYIYGFNKNNIIYTSVITLCAIIIHLFSIKDKNWLRIDTVFIVGFIIVNFQWPLMYVLTEHTPTYSFQDKSIKKVAEYAVSISAVGIISWMLGFSLERIIHNRYKYYNIKISDTVTGVNLLIICFLSSLAGFVLYAGSSFFNRYLYRFGNDSLFQTVTGPAAYLYTASEILAILTLAVVIYKYVIFKREGPRRSIFRVSLSAALAIILLGAFCVVFVLGGDRGEVVIILLGAGLALASRVRPVRIWEFIPLAALGFLIFSYIGVWRTGAEPSGASLSGEFGLWQISTNFAQSIVPLTQSIIIVDREGLFFGQLWISQLLGLIPFAQSFFLSNFDFLPSDVSSAVLVTRYTFGNDAPGGLGTSFVADIYLNFGVPGLVVIPVLYGAICARMSVWLYGDQGFLRYFVAVAFACFILYMTRSSILFQLKPIVWGVGFAFLLLKVRRLR